MGVIYNSQSISGYNTSPPPDDASTGSDNEITWAKHKTKLGDPIKTLSEAINTELAAAFAKVHFYGITSLTTTYTVLATDRGRLINCTSGTFTVTLLAAATATLGFEVTIYNSGTGVITIDGDGAETVNGAATLVLQPGGWANITTDGSSWEGITYEPATQAEVTTGADATKIVTPLTLATNLTPDVVTGFTAAKNVYFATADGFISPVFDVDAILGAAWESFGPTSSGATNEWTAMDNLPANTVAVLVKFYLNVSGATTGDVYAARLKARPTGSSTSETPHDSNIASAQFEHSAVAGSEGSDSTVEVWLKVDSSRRFDLYMFTGGTSPALICDATLIGFAE